ncbi:MULTISPECIES: patatin-like protein [unclassified Geodermatophilus]|uniref:patatin-like protein n=1 Tax=unclassified Geodermatophilus TaxID=2637632 RepID=UPI003EE9A3B6
MTTGRPEDRIQLRLALVCYGGVSLAVYMHGVTKELHKLVRASRRFDDVDDLEAPNPFPDDDTEAAYFEALRELAQGGRRLSVTIDIVAGTSAGGINGVVLGKVLARDGDQDGLRKLWIEEGDLRKLLRGPRVGGLRLRAALAGLRLAGLQLFGSDKATSPLRGERMSRLLIEAMRDIDVGARGDATLLPRSGSLDLFVTLTDLHGFQVLVPSGAGGASQRDRQHAQVLRFSARYGDTGEFGPEATPDLAFAARATSSFPGAFAPVSVTSFGQECDTRMDRETLSQRFVYRYDEQGARAVNAWFVDGGVLDNAPFDLVVHAIGRKRAESEVIRSLIYIQPDPGQPLATAPPADSGGAPPPAPSWLQGVGKAVLGVRGSQGVLRDLFALRDLNTRISEVGSIAANQMAQAQRLLDDAVPRADEDALSWEVSREGFQAVSDEVHRGAQRELGASYASYCRLKAGAAARRMADEVARRFVWPPDAGRTAFVRAAIGAWARGREEWNDPDPTRLMEMLGPVDLPYRERRLLFLLAGVNDLYDCLGEGPHAPTRSDLDTLKRLAWDLMDQLHRVPGEAVAGVPDALVQFLSADRVDPALLEDPQVFAEEHADDFPELFEAYRDSLTRRLGDGGAQLWQAFETSTKGWGRTYRRALLSRYLAFPFWDGLIFPTVALSEVPQFSPIGVAQFSPLAAGALVPPEGGKLKGVSLHHFAGFVKPEWRENDYLWGRLDGVELVLRTLYTAGSARPAVADTAPPESQEAAVRTAGGAVLQRGLRGVLAAESGLRRIAAARRSLLQQVEALPLA